MTPTPSPTKRWTVVRIIYNQQYNKRMDELITYIGEKWRCTPNRYPEMEGMSEDERFRFVLRHSALHFAKTAGKIAATSEDVDHGEKINIKDLKRNAVKSLINSLYLAGQLKMTESELTALTKEIVGAK